MSDFDCGSEMQILMPAAQSGQKSAVEQRADALPWMMEPLGTDLLTPVIGTAPPWCTSDGPRTQAVYCSLGVTADYSWCRLCRFDLLMCRCGDAVSVHALQVDGLGRLTYPVCGASKGRTKASLSD